LGVTDPWFNMHAEGLDKGKTIAAEIARGRHVQASPSPHVSKIII
jgi:hypothetical protein